MRFDGLDAIPDDWPRSVVTVGVFDGVHSGHRSIIEAARRAADGGGPDGSVPTGQVPTSPVPVVAVTFDPHPSEVVRPGSHPTMLSTLDHRIELLLAAGCDAVLVLPFTADLSRRSPQEFAARVLAGRLHARTVVVGANFRFGHRASGSVETLAELGKEHDFTVEVLELRGADTVSWSSSYVRQCVLEGDVTEAARVLQRPHRVTGVVVHGDHRGRELGYPTANLLPVEYAAIPADGVYAGWLVRLSARPPGSAAGAESRLPAAISIGTNPTFDGVGRRIEAYVLDRTDLDLYGEPVAVEFVEHLRPTLRFDGVDALLGQMADDVERSREITGRAAPS